MTETESARLVLVRRVTQQECHWLPRDLEEGEEFWEFNGPTYGCVTPNGTAVTIEPDVAPFFEIPDNSWEEVVA